MSKEDIRALRDLIDDPSAQATLALALLQRISKTPKRGRKIGDRELTQAVLRVLDKTPTPDARQPLLDLYARYAENGVSFDAGGYVRAAILTALRPGLEQADRALLAQAVATYEFPPPQFKEETAPLRSAALVSLNALDDKLTRFHAARLLADEYTDPMSGEPALSAVRVLGTQGETALLYHYATQRESATVSEVLAEALRNLVDLPKSLLEGLIERHGESEQDVVLAGLFDLLLTHEFPLEERSVSQEFMGQFMGETEQYDVYQYLISTAVAQIASGNEPVWTLLREHVEQQTGLLYDVEKVHILLSALSVLAYNNEVAEYLSALQNRIDNRVL